MARKKKPPSSPKPRKTCTPPTTLRFGSTPRLLATFAKPGSDGRIRLDISDLRWIEALPMALLVAYLKKHATNGGWINMPDKKGFLQRMDFFQVLGTRLEEKFVRKDSSGRFVPLRVVSNGSEVGAAAEAVVQTLRVEGDDAAKTLRHAIGEILDNVFVHSRSPIDAVVCAQHFPNARRSQVAIVDGGIGFAGSFSDLPAAQEAELTDRDALTLGMAPFVTSKPRQGLPYESPYGRLGVGLFIAADIIDSVGGTLQIASGTALFRRHLGRRKWTSVPAWAGTSIGFEIPDEPLVAYDEALAAARMRARAESGQRAGR